jgi:5-methylcytosine-specific restriction enzyme subunit McrC
MAQTILTVFEDKQKKLELTPSQSEDILAFRSILGKGRLSLSYDGWLHVRRYVGFISKGKTRLQILPKIYETVDLDNETEKREAMRVMLNLLVASQFNNVLGLSNQNSFANQTDILEIFISIFADKIFHTYSRQMNREYNTITENSSFIRGRIDFAASLRINPIRRDLHVVNFQSFEHDNLINNIIKSVCIKLLHLTCDMENKKKLKIALVFLDDAHEISLSKDLFEAAKFTSLNMPFKPVFDMAKMFFHNLTPQGYQGDDTVCSFLVPLNELFEYYTYKVMNGFSDEISASYQKSRIFAHNQTNDFQHKIRPDIILYKDAYPLLIADAKYKNPEYKKGIYKKVSQSDIYQIFAYASVYGVKSAALIYPLFNDVDTLPMVVELENTNNKVILMVVCIDIRNSDIETASLILRKKLAIDIFLQTKDRD